MMNNSQYIPIDDDKKPVEEAIEELQTYTEGGRKVEYILKLMRRLKGILDFSCQFNEHGQMDQNQGKLTFEEIFGLEKQSNEGILLLLFYYSINFIFLRKVQSAGYLSRL